MTTGAAMSFLSSEYLAELEALAAVDRPVLPNANVRLQYHVTDAPEGTVDYYLLIDRGAIVKADRGRIKDSDLAISATYGDLVEFHSGDLHAATAFVTGQFAVTGDKAKLLELMLVLQSGYYYQLNADLWPRTTW